MSKLFQSAPANYGGRINKKALRLLAWSSFNPRPPITAGESWILQPGIQAHQRFNPRPPITAGESLGRWGCVVAMGVSIRARQLRRANLRYHRTSGGRSLCFNPRPPITAGESMSWQEIYNSDGFFNPRPPITAGESPLDKGE